MASPAPLPTLRPRPADKSLAVRLAGSWPTEESARSVSRPAIRRDRGEEGEHRQGSRGGRRARHARRHKVAPWTWRLGSRRAELLLPAREAGVGRHAQPFVQPRGARKGISIHMQVDPAASCE